MELESETGSAGSSRRVADGSRRRDIGGFSAARRRAVRTLAILGLLTFGFSVFLVLQEVAFPVANESALEPAGSPAAQFGADHPGETVHVAGAIAALLVGASGIASLALRPNALGSAYHTAAAMLGSVVAMGIVGDPDNHGGMAGSFDVAFLIFAVPALAAALVALPWSRLPRPAFDRAPWLLAGVGLPLLWYGTEQALLQRNTWPPLADPHHQAHWYMMAVVAFMLVLVAASAAAKATGWRIALSSTGLAAAALAISSLVAPLAASALTLSAAVALLLWAGVAIALGVRDRTGAVDTETSTQTLDDGSLRIDPGS